MMTELYTIGHSNHPIETFLGLLKQHGITAVCDVRSHPYSKHHPQFSYPSLPTEVKRSGLVYVFLGNELGARSNDSSCYLDGKVQYARLAQTPLFQTGIQRLLKGLESYRIALMCAEQDPLSCHRTILIGRHLRNLGLPIKHILGNGDIETQQEAEQRLLQLLKIPSQDLFATVDQLIERAYDLQGQKIAYQIDSPQTEDTEPL
jgi:uncharacterized protein (DUF488 family)